MVDVQEIADAIVMARRKARLTQRQVAAKAGIAPNTMIRIERGQSVRHMSLHAVATALDVDLDELTAQPSAADAAVAAEMAAAFVGDGDDSRERLLYLTRVITHRSTTRP